MAKIIISILLICSLRGNAQVAMWHAHNQPTADTFLLDLYPNAAVAYSIRKLSRIYNGSAIRVRRTSDNTESDIGFNSSFNLDTAALKTFVGAGDGYVYTWYDQSGNGNNATGNGQARIVQSGVVTRQGGWPAIEFSTALNSLLTFNNIVSSNIDWSMYMAIKRPAASTAGIGFSNSGNGPLVSQNSDNRFYIQRATTGTSGFYRSAPDATFDYSLIETYNISAITSGYKNNVAYSLNAELGFTANVLGFTTIGKYGAGTFLVGKANEMIIYSLDKTSTRSSIISNINSYYTIY